VRTRKLPPPQVIDDALFKPSAPSPPANSTAQAAGGLDGRIRMNACLAPRGVSRETSLAACACAEALPAASNTELAATLAATIRPARFMRTNPPPRE
jgi:hypothetical protein